MMNRLGIPSNAAAFATAVNYHDDEVAALSDVAADLRAEGASWRDLAAGLGVHPNSAKERFGCFPRPFEAVRFTRRVGSYGVTKPPRVTVVDRFIVADLAGSWRIVRHCADEGEAVQLAAYLGDEGVARYVKRPRDIVDDPPPWHLGPLATIPRQEGAA